MANDERLDFTDHVNKCRVCLKPFEDDEQRMKINNEIQRRFLEVTQIELRIMSCLSKNLCVVCYVKLEDFCDFRTKSVELQAALEKVAPVVFIKTEREPAVIIEHRQLVQPQSEFLDFVCDLKVDPSPHIKYEDCDTNLPLLENSLYFVCSECDLSFRGQSQLSLHYAKAHRSFGCDQCEFKAFSKRSMNKHMLAHETKDVVQDVVETKEENLQSSFYGCSDCSATFKSFKWFQKHRIRKHKTPRIQKHKTESKKSKSICQHCSKTFSGGQALRDHITVFHSSVKPELPCPIKSCTRVFLTQKRLSAHVILHDNDAKEMCPECGLLFTSKHTLRRHIASVHTKLKNFSCDLCDYSATFKQGISCHMVSHVDPNERRKWHCDTCNFVSVSKQSLRAHKEYEHSGNVYTCHCGKEFKQKPALTAHIKYVHLKIKDHKCNLCDKAFFSRKNLGDHKKSKHEEKSMPCEICGKLFATQKLLNCHRLYHTEPKFKCTFAGCTKVFIIKATLKQHMKFHEGKRDFLCHLCDKSYFRQNHLQLHLDVAHKATTFHCELCTFTNSRKDYLRNHLNSAHKHLTLEQKSKILARAKVTRKAV